MSSREANIENLNDTIATLSEDAESLHGLIARSTSELKSATEVGNKATNNATKIIETLMPLTELFEVQHHDSTAMLDEARKASEEQRTTTTEQIESLKDAVDETLKSVSSTTEATYVEIKQTIEGSFSKLIKTQDETFNELKAKTLKDHEIMRDELQTDILSFKNATSARLDVLEARITKVESSVKELENKVDESISSATKKLLIPIYAAIGIGVISLIGLVILLMR